MDTNSKLRMRSRAILRLDSEAVVQTDRGGRTLDQLLMGGIRARDIAARLFDIFAAPFEGRISSLETEKDLLAGQHRSVKAEATATRRKLAQRREVVVWEDMSLPEVMEVVLLHREGVSAVKIANLFEIPLARVKEVLQAAEGKHRDKVLFDSESRRQRLNKTRARPELSGRRDVDVETVDSGEPQRLHLHNGSSLS